MNKYGIFYNPFKIEIKTSLNKKIDLLCRQGFSVFALNKQKNGYIKKVNYIENFAEVDIDILLVFGGDGTILRAFQEIIGLEIPILGFNLGRLGFLSDCKEKDFEESIEKIIRKEYILEKRIAIKGIAKKREFYALNEILLDKGLFPKIIHLEIFRDNHLIVNLYANGVIVSTPTGSTAYSLSAGGSVMEPSLDAVSITPICAQAYSLKPIILPINQEIKIRVGKNASEVQVVADDNIINSLSAEEELVIRKAEFQVIFVKFYNKDFFSILQEKLHLRT